MTTVTLDLDDDVVATLRSEAERTGRPSAEIVAAAVRRYVKPSVIDELGRQNDLDEDEATTIAVQAVREVRAERDREVRSA